MKKNILSIIMMFAGLLLFTACGSKEGQKAEEIHVVLLQNDESEESKEKA